MGQFVKCGIFVGRETRARFGEPHVIAIPTPTTVLYAVAIL